MNPHRRSPLAARVLVRLAAAVALAAGVGWAQRPNPFQPPAAKVHYAPDRSYDLKHLTVRLTVDYGGRRITGIATNVLAPLRGPLAEVRLHCGKQLTVSSCSVNGQKATFTRDGEFLVIVPPGGPLPAGKDAADTLLTLLAEAGTFAARPSPPTPDLPPGVPPEMVRYG